MRNQGVGSWAARRARMSPDRTALRYEDRRWTYRQVHHRATRLAHGLRSLGVRPGDRVAYLGPNHPTFLEALFAVGELGAVYVPLNVRLAPPELAYILDDCAARLLLYSPRLEPTVQRLRPLVSVPHLISTETGHEELIAAAPGDPIDEPVDPTEICMIMYTSGTTGKPKGVMLSHANIAWNSFNLLLDVDLAGDEVTLVSAPMFHVAALNQTVLPTYLKGGTCLLVSAFDPAHALDLIERHRVTYMFGVPAMFLAIAQSPRWASADLSSVRSLACGGAPVPEALIYTYQQRGLTFLQGYGMTEAAPGALFLRADESRRKAGSAGTPTFFSDVRVVHPDGTAVSPGEPGEILVHGPNVMPGYWQRPAETATVLDADGWFHSGDVGVLDADGYVYVRDRLKDMYISGGENVYPAEVEDVLYRHPAVADCAVIGVPDATWGEVGRAVVVLRDGAGADSAQILDFLVDKVAKYKIPASVVFTDALPRTASGKVVKSQLRARFGGAPAAGGGAVSGGGGAGSGGGPVSGGDAGSGGHPVSGAP